LQLRWWRWGWLLRRARSTAAAAMAAAVVDSMRVGSLVMVDLLRRVGLRVG
jgi:hypothetical protein